MDCFINGRSHFSIGESILLPSEVVKQAAEVGYRSVAISDTMNVNALPELFNAAREAGVKPILGARLRIVDKLFTTQDEKKKYKPYYLRVIVNNHAGYQALLKLLSRANEESHFYAEARLLLSDVAELMGQAGKGACVVTLGDFYGAYSAGKARVVVETLHGACVDVVSEIMPIDTPHFVRVAHDAFKMQDEYGVPVICGMPAFYSDAKHAESLDVMKAIAANMKMGERSTRHAYRDFVTHSTYDIEVMATNMADRMVARYGENLRHWVNKWDASFQASEGVSAGVSFEWHKLPPSLPKMAEDEFEALKQACLAGWKKRFSKPVFGHQPTDLRPYAERLKHELSVLRKMKFEAYFLLVADIMQWAKANGIRCGAGRGSSGGSLIAYLLEIVDSDPIRFDLLFSRFINESRLDLPDADLDFMGMRRGEVVDYIRERFGNDKTARIANYTSMLAAGSLNNICRTLDFDAGIAFAKYVPKEHGMSASLKDTIEQSPELSKFADANPQIMDLAWPLEDRMRSYGLHAAGVIVANVPLVDRAVVSSRGGERVINWDKSVCEDFGLVKIDVLGLSTLDMIDVTLKLIQKNYGVHINQTDIPLDDVRVLEEFGCGRATGVFQMEASVPRNMLVELAKVSPLTFEDLIVVNALNRPGPLEASMDKSYCRRKNLEEKVSYPHPLAEKTLKNSFGVIVFQEQIQQLFIDIAGFSGSEADNARKSIGKKDLKKMESLKDKFLAGAINNGMTDTDANKLWGDIVGFASYAFNRSHSCCYAILSYVCQYLKVYYPAEFFAGLLSFVKEERREAALKDMRRLGIKLLPPDINHSGPSFETLHEKAILAPFNAIKGISDTTTNAILDARQAGSFASKTDFLARVNKTKCNVKHQRLLDEVGAFAAIEPGQLAPDHPDRRRDQVEYMPGLMDGVQIDRNVVFDEFALQALTDLVTEYRNCDKCELAGLCHPKPYVTAPPKMMLVFDSPNWKEEKADQMGVGSQMESVNIALGEAGFELSDCYITSLVKSPKPSKDKPFSNKTLSACAEWLDKEIDLIKPPLVIVMGREAARRFMPEMKGLAEYTGKVLFDRERDMNVLIGMNVGLIHFHPEKQDDLNQLMKKAATLLDRDVAC